MDHNTQFVPFKIDPIITEAETVQGLARPFKFAEMVQIAFEHFLRQAAKFSQDVQLQFARHFGQFRRADGIENDLELHAAKLNVNAPPVENYPPVRPACSTIPRAKTSRSR